MYHLNKSNKIAKRDGPFWQFEIEKKVKKWKIEQVIKIEHIIMMFANY